MTDNRFSGIDIRDWSQREAFCEIRFPIKLMDGTTHEAHFGGVTQQMPILYVEGTLIEMPVTWEAAEALIALSQRQPIALDGIQFRIESEEDS